MFIEGLSIAGYRSFGDLQRIGPCQKVTLLVGPNNCGKSNILSFLKEPFAQSVKSVQKSLRGKPYEFKETDRHVGDSHAPFAFGLAASAQGPWFDKISDRARSLLNQIEQIISSQTLTKGTGIAWFEYHSPGPNQPMQLSGSLFESLGREKIIPHHEWEHVWRSLTNHTGGGALIRNWIPETLRELSPVEYEYPHIWFVPAFRQITADKPVNETHDERDLSGAGLIDRLVRLERPPFNRQGDKDRFEGINEFVRSVTDNPSATLEIPYERDMITVHMDDKSLPLICLGTGIHQVIILAAAATVVEHAIVCMEEPELHLHPLLQRKLVRYLIEKTSNQYFISTHSAHLLETEDAAVFRVQMRNGQSQVSSILTPSDRWEVCRDLGYRASDLVQANCTVWVEGPSDRIYLNHWMKAADPNLIEGIHYSVMFYGGRLLRHLTANDPEVDDFISLRRLNRNMVVVADSDKDSAHRHINATKKRICNELSQGPGFAWITKGRAIENYVEESTLRKAVETVRRGMGSKVKYGQYTCALPIVNPRAKNPATVDKIKVAREVANHTAKVDGVLDLKKQIATLVSFVNECNR